MKDIEEKVAETLYRVDERTKRMDSRIERMEIRMGENHSSIYTDFEEIHTQVEDIDNRVRRNSTILSGVTVGSATILTALMTKLAAVFKWI